MTPEWEKLANGVKGTVKVAYWDTEQQGRRPPLLGDFKGTPTIRLYVPKAKQGLSNRKKKVLDYNYERKAKDMKQFLDQNMPNFAEPIRGSLTAFSEKAARHGLPQAVLFTSKARTSSLVKFLTTQFRRRLLLAEVYPTSKNTDLMAEYGISKDDLPALLVLQENGEGPIRYDGTEFTRRKLENYLSKYALKEPVAPKKKEEGSGEKKQGETKGDEQQEVKQKVKTEL